MSEKRIGIIMHGVTGRMGMNQHLIRSILEIRKQGGVALKDGTRVMPDPLLVGRNAAKVEELARRHGVERWTTDLDAALERERGPDLLRRCLDAIAAEAPEARDRGGQARLLREAGRYDARGGEGPLRGGEESTREARRGAGQAVAAGTAQARRSCKRAGLLRPHPFGARRVRLLGVRGRPKGNPPPSGPRGTTASRTAAASSSTCCATGATCSTTCSARCRR